MNSQAPAMDGKHDGELTQPRPDLDGQMEVAPKTECTFTDDNCEKVNTQACLHVKAQAVCQHTQMITDDIAVVPAPFGVEQGIDTTEKTKPTTLYESTCRLGCIFWKTKCV